MPGADVIVVGCGPAGAVAARELALSGVDVLVLERARFPRDKPCGDTLTAACVDVLRDLGLLDRLADGRRILGHRLVSLTHGGSATSLYEEARGRGSFGLVIPRLTLDSVLAAVAKEAGATLLEDRTVVDVIGTNGAWQVAARGPHGLEVFNARFIIGADGAVSVVRRRTAPETSSGRAGWAIRCYVDGVELPSLFQVHGPLQIGGRLLSGYGWVSPMQGGRANVGIGLFRLHPGDTRVDRRRLLEDFVEHLMRSDPMFRDATPSGVLGGPLPIARHAPAILQQPVCLAGDAAGLSDPVSGEGILHALRSGIVAGRNLSTRALGQPPPTAETDEFNRHARRRWERGAGVLESIRFAWRGIDSCLEVPRRSFRVIEEAVLQQEVPSDGRLGVLLEEGISGKRSVGEEFPFIREFCDAAQRRIGGQFLRDVVEGAAGPMVSDVRVQRLALACELAVVRMLVDADAVAAQEVTRNPRWANSFVILTSDYLFGLSSALLADLGPPYVEEFFEFLVRESEVGLSRGTRGYRDIAAAVVELAGTGAGLAARLAARDAVEIVRLQRRARTQARRWMRKRRRFWRSWTTARGAPPDALLIAER